MGIYVQERYYDAEITLKNRIREFLFEGKAPLDLNRCGYDMDLFLAVNREEQEKISRYRQSGKTVLLLRNDQSDDVVNTGNIILFNSNTDILFNLIDGMFKNGIISKSIAEEFKILAQFFIQRKVADLLIATKCFFIPKEKDIYKKYYEKFRRVTQGLFGILKMEHCNWGTERYMYLQFAALNIAYEGNAYCRRNQGAVLYNTDGLVDICQILLKNEEARFLIGNSLNLLLANIYDNLTKSDKAFDYYLKACNEYNAFAYYKKALLVMNTGNDYELSEKYLIKCLSIYPEYVRAWYMLGLCYSHQERLEKAQQAWEYLKFVLRQRKQAHILSTMETEHLYLSALSSGNMKLERLMDFEGALYEYEYAKEICDEIPDTEFYKAVGMPAIADQNIKHMQEVLSVNVVYSKMGECYLREGDIECANEVLAKLPQ